MATVDWTCPFCGKDVLINEAVSRTWDSARLHLANADGLRDLLGVFTECPNPKCRHFTLAAHLFEVVEKTKTDPRSGIVSKDKERGRTLQTWRLIPASAAKVFPSYIPKAILDDYNEACAIRDVSPKASATLSRRCLQGMIRDFWQVAVKSKKLAHEIDAIKDKVTSEVWDALDGVRKIGNIGAHMEADVNVIVDVDPEEAGLLIRLIEMLLSEWYVARENRRQALAEVTKLAAEKSGERSG